MTRLEMATKAAVHELQPSAGWLTTSQSLFEVLKRQDAPRWESIERSTRAAIASLREPSGAQISAAADKALQVGSGDFVAIWQAMLDAVLKEPAE